MTRSASIALGLACLVSAQATARSASLRGPVGPSDFHVVASAKISSTSGGFAGVLANGVQFGTAVASLGDLDGDGVGDVAVGAPLDNNVTIRAGSVWILFLNADGTVKAHRKIDGTPAGGSVPLTNGDELGDTIACLGDVDGNGVPDLAVGAPQNHAGASGSVRILFLDETGAVIGHQRIDDQSGGGPPIPGTQLRAVAGPGDVDGDRVPDLALARPGRVFVLLLNTDGTVRELHEELDTAPELFFGRSVAPLGDLDGNGVPDLVAGLPGLTALGGLRLLYLEATGAVSASQDLDMQLCTPEILGWTVFHAGDLDGDGTEEIFAGHLFEQEFWAVSLATGGTIEDRVRFDRTHGGLSFEFERGDGFGASIATIADLDGNGFPDLVVGSSNDDDGGTDRGAAWVLYLAPGPAPPPSPLGTPYCSPAVPNSTGSPGRLTVLGSTDLGANRFDLAATDLPTGSDIGYFLMGTGNSVTVPPGSAGPICVFPGLRRLLPSVQRTDERCGGFDRWIQTGDDLFDPVTPGSTWNFQAWHRDAAAGTSNFTDAVRVVFD